MKHLKTLEKYVLNHAVYAVNFRFNDSFRSVKPVIIIKLQLFRHNLMMLTLIQALAIIAQILLANGETTKKTLIGATTPKIMEIANIAK